MKDYTKYLLIPYKHQGRTFQGADCFGLLRLFYKEELSIDLPDFTEDYSKDWWLHSNFFLDLCESYGFVKTNEFALGNIVFFRNNGVKVGHVGVVLTDGMFLHMGTYGANITSYTTGIYQRQLHSVYSYQKVE